MRWVAALLLGGALVAVSGPPAYAQEVIVNPSVQEDSVSKNTLRAIFGMRYRTWPDGTPITVYVLDDRDAVHDAFAKKQLGMFPHQLRQAWDRLVYSGTGQAPITVSSELEMRKRVAVAPGGIGYLTKDWVDESVRVLQIR